MFIDPALAGHLDDDRLPLAGRVAAKLSLHEHGLHPSYRLLLPRRHRRFWMLRRLQGGQVPAADLLRLHAAAGGGGGGRRHPRLHIPRAGGAEDNVIVLTVLAGGGHHPG